ncbi:hypothetical protein [Mycoplasmopsis cynos]|uniref:hypothetical protein n=1 Tax=Mycoplasmopsis cynos TaxID=171284 RepID=UPI0024CB7329|nr:hypothetical protein [Mycoplasmopsis cynos]WAM07486.1 hypothetical protein ONA21_04945 [Mycoplasmopsis cynos]
MKPQEEQSNAENANNLAKQELQSAIKEVEQKTTDLATKTEEKQKIEKEKQEAEEQEKKWKGFGASWRRI